MIRKIKIFFKKESIFYFSVFVLILLSFFATYYKYGILKDYIVAYEAECDPSTESCYVGCSDDNCESNYYFKIIEKKAFDLFRSCGNAVINCDDAQFCSESDSFCNVIICTPDSTTGEECYSFDNLNL